MNMISSYLKAGKIVSKVRDDASKLIEDGMPVLELVNHVEGSIRSEVPNRHSL